MSAVYFDVTDVVYFAARFNRVTGIQRVQLNIIGQLARKHGGAVIRCCFFDRNRGSVVEFDPSQCRFDAEFDAENFLFDIGMASPSGGLLSKLQVKTYLRSFGDRKVLRAFKKVELYLLAYLAPARVAKMGFRFREYQPVRPAIAVAPLVPAKDQHYVCMGSVWVHPEIWPFARAHRAAGGDVVQLVHDLIPLLYPQYTPSNESAAFKAWLDAALEYSSRFIAISDWTARDLTRYAGQGARHPSVTRIPLAHEFMRYERNQPVETPPELADLEGRKFAVCVGTIELRKNPLGLLEAWKTLVGELGSATPCLVFAGRFGLGADEFREFLHRHKDVAAHVIVLHSPSDRGLAWLYAKCQFAVLPSRIEGWGLPVGEAAWFGKFCVASSASSIPEVCGDLADYFDPDDAAGMVAALRRAIVDRDYLERKQQSIQAARLRLWSDVADDIFDFVTAGQAR